MERISRCLVTAVAAGSRRLRHPACHGKVALFVRRGAAAAATTAAARGHYKTVLCPCCALETLLFVDKVFLLENAKGFQLHLGRPTRRGARSVQTCICIPGVRTRVAPHAHLLTRRACDRGPSYIRLRHNLPLCSHAGRCDRPVFRR